MLKLISRIINRISLIGKIVHLYRIKKSKKILKKLHEIKKTDNYQPKIINYLRKINPYVFEELILTSIENANIYIIRNKRYSGDGGVDGIFKIKQGKVLIQCKRYSSYINSRDVEDLSNKVKNDKFYYGIFVHTGKTGDKSKEIVKNQKNIMYISGSVLVDMILGDLNVKELIAKRVNGK